MIAKRRYKAIVPSTDVEMHEDFDQRQKEITIVSSIVSVYGEITDFVGEGKHN